MRVAMRRADRWSTCRVGYVETMLAVQRSAGWDATRAVEDDWPEVIVVEVDQTLVEDAVRLALAHDLRSLDAMHLAAALTLPPDNLVFASWDRRLHVAAVAAGLEVLPRELG